MLIFVAFQVLLLLTSTNTNANVRHPLVHRNKRAVAAAAAAYQVADFRTGVQKASTSGEYLVTIRVGPTNQTLAIDTGSDLTWVQCKPCDHCFDSSGNGLFDPAKSSTIQSVPCAGDDDDTSSDPNALICYKLDEKRRRCSDSRCGFDFSYADGSYTRGTLIVESLAIGDDATSSSLVANVAMGCGHDNNVSSFDGEVDGVLGLGWGSLSLSSQSTGVTGGAFTYCLGRGVSGGWLEFGRSGFPREAAWARLVKNPKRPSLYYVELTGLEVGGEAVEMPEDALKGLDLDSGEGGTIIDSGTTVTLLVEAAYVALRDKFKSKMEGLLSPAEPNPIFDTCYDANGVDFKKVAPAVSFVFSGIVTRSLENVIRVNASNVLVRVITEAGYRACFAFGGLMGTSLNIIGNQQQEGFQISFDASGGYVSFVPGVC